VKYGQKAQFGPQGTVFSSLSQMKKKEEEEERKKKPRAIKSTWKTLIEMLFTGDPRARIRLQRQPV